MKIALVRGPYVNRFELQNWEPLTRVHQVKVFYPNNNFFDVSDIELSKEQVLTYESFLGKTASNYLRVLWHFPFGYYHGIPSLVKKLEGFDIVHGAETFYVFDRQIIRAKRKYGCAAVFTVWENIPFAHESRPFMRRAKSEVLKGADLFVAMSERSKIALMLEGVDESRISLIPVGVDITRFRPGEKDGLLLKQMNMYNDDFVVSFIGRLTYEKGVFELINAFALFAQNRQNVRLLMVGDGPLRDTIEKRISRLGIEKQVKLATFPYSQMPKVHRLADVLVLPSIPTREWQEQFGMVLVEAMSTGVPIVTTMSGSIQEVVQDAAYLIQPGDTLALFKALKELEQNEGLREELIAKGLRRSRTFDRELVSRRLQDAYQELV